MDLRPPVARYRQIAAHLRDAIHAGTYGPGDALPSETTLAKQFKVSRPIANKAIGVLVNEGLVDVRHGSGSYVRARRLFQVVASYTTDNAAWASEADRQGLRGTQRVEVATVPACLEVADALGIEQGKPVVRRRRVMLLNDEPVELADSHYPTALAAGTELARPAKLPGGTNAALGRLGIALAEFREQVSTRMPTRDERDRLDLPAGIPVLRQVRLTIAVDGTPVEHCEMILRGDQHTLSYTLPATR